MGDTMTLLHAFLGIGLSATILIDAAALASQDAPAKKPATATGDSLSANAAEYDGWKVYHSNCDRCHGQDATGSTFASDLRQTVGANGMTEATFASVVGGGRPDKGMPAFKSMLSSAQISQLFAYVKARSAGTLGPGRPKRPA